MHCGGGGFYEANLWTKQDLKQQARWFVLKEYEELFNSKQRKRLWANKEIGTTKELYED